MCKKEQMFCLASHSRMWCIPFCMAAFSLLPGAYSSANADNLALETALIANSVQQQRTVKVKGVVLDTNGESVIGANVKEVGGGAGTITDINGEFSLDISPRAVLEISFIGYSTQRVSVNASNSVKVTLSENTKVLDEVVITGFGMSQKKATLTGAVSSIKSDDIEHSSAATASGALVGKIAGLNTRQQDGRPGSSTALQIRNMGDPLFVIDGVQSDGGQFNNLDFNDIESISILKDASAAIYGIRAANGVVVVTTKKGRRNTKNTVSLNAYYGWQKNSVWIKPADAKTYVKAYAAAETWAGKSDSERRYPRAEYDKWMAGTEKGYQGFDWNDYIWGSAPQYYVNANFSGGTEKANYYVALSHLGQDATVHNYGGFKRTNVQMNIDMNVNERFKIGATMNGRIESRQNPGVPGGDDYWLPRFAVMKNWPTTGPYANDNPLYPQKTSTDDNTNFAILNYKTSGKMTDVWRVIQMQATAEYEILKGLKAKAMVGYYFAYREQDNHEYTYKLYRYDTATDTYPVTVNMSNPYRERTRSKVEDQFSNFQLNYDHKFGQHSINAIAGFEASQRRTPSIYVHSIPVANNMNLINFKEVDTYNDDGNNTQARLGWLGRINYNYGDKYLLELIGRWDGSWKFPPNKRWGFFPSASLGWRISQEKFWQESKLAKIFTDLKLRGSYGLVGDDNVSGYSAFDYMEGYDYKNGGSVIDGQYVVGTKPRGLPNTTLSWIKAKILDIGVDMGFLNNRLTAQADFFRRIRTGLPAGRYDVLLPSELGFSLPNENLNSDVNIGYDAMVRWADQINDFNYSVGANVTYSRFYDWEQYDNRRSNSWDTYRNSIWHRVGYVNWGLTADGRFKDWEEIADYPIDNDRQGNTTVVPGDIKYKDVNNDGVINGMDERPIGYRSDSTPNLNFGINLSAGWKGFDLSMDWTGSSMTSWFQQYETAHPFQNDGNSPAEIFNDAWHLSDVWDANSELIPGKYPLVRLNDNDSPYWKSTFWVHNVSYIKLRNLELGYTLPKMLLNKTGISNVRFYFSGSNLLTLTNVPIDPEGAASNGLDYPTMRVINIGVNLKF
ncbi:TonB-dependent receptor [uncultured Bacteroides sp.]|uniref:SusC/RagA family TonB-linked outer membrane protein n=1 Tax=uncultured Bacteroides sp. TaxID=162156 RepID=UPI002AA9181C|nr:TonB-dependent receptor [uncultured Bacteroides sp.]